MTNSLLYRLLFLTFLVLPQWVAGKEPPDPPVPPRLVNDYAGILSASERNALERKLVAYDDSTSTQIAIVTEASLEGDDIFDYSFRLAEKWGIGGGENDNGVLIYIAIQDRKIRIQTGYGVEGFLPDVMARRIIDKVIVPNFRANQYYTGLDKATEIIMQLGSGEYSNERVYEEDFPWGVLIFVIIFIIFIILINKGGGGGYHRGGRYDSGGGWIIWGPGGGGHGGWGGGGGGGFGGGGFGGFGGGGFGGGGAGGSW